MNEWDYKDVWQETMSLLRAEVGEQEFSIWFSNLEYLRGGENSLFIKAPSSFYRDQVIKRYQNRIISTLAGLIGRDLALNFEVVPQTTENRAVQPEPPAQNEKTGMQSSHKTPETDTARGNSPAKQAKNKHPQLQEDYTFDRFIISEFNSFAANAAIAISKNPGKSYNPFFIYGGVGLGKTHLMQAIGNSVYENSDNKVICVTSEDFLNEYVEGTRQGKMNAFKNKFRYTDVLLIDDIQFLQNKPGVQEELFFTFNALINAKKQLVFTCDRPPSELEKFSERLMNRFEMGVKVDIQTPRYEDRCAILKSTAESRQTSIPNEVIDLIAKNISSNIRDLKGALNTLISYTEIMGKPVTLEIAQQKLRDVLVSSRQSNMSIDNIQRVVAEYFNLSPNDLKGKKKTKNIVFPRQLSMYIAREITDFSTTELGESFGGRDHATVIYSIEKIKGQLLTNPALDSQIENLKRLIREYIAKS
jgi:chromosomal replication initiator protein